MQSIYTLNDTSFKKLAKGVKARLNTKLPEEHSLSHHFVMQALAQEMFSMSYEEAKATVLSQHSTFQLPGAPKEEETSPFSEEDKTLRYLIHTMLKLHGYIPISMIPELSEHSYWWNGMAAEDPELKARLDALNAKTHAQRQEDWGSVPEILFGLYTQILAHDSAITGKPITLRQIASGFTLSNLISHAKRQDLPGELKKAIRELLHKRGLDVNNEDVIYAYNLLFNREREPFLMTVNLLMESLEKRFSKPEKAHSAEHDHSRMKTLKQALTEQVIKCLPDPNSNVSAWVDAVWCAAQFRQVIKASYFHELSFVSNLVDLVNGQQHEILSEMLENEERNSDPWHKRAKPVLIAFGEALRMEVLRKGNTLSLETYRSNLGLPVMVDLAKNERIPPAFRKPMLAFLSSLSPQMDNVLNKGETPSAVSEEQFAYVFMGHWDLIAKLKENLRNLTFNS